MFATYITWRGLFGKIKNHKLGEDKQIENEWTKDRSRLYLEEEARNTDLYL